MLLFAGPIMAAMAGEGSPTIYLTRVVPAHEEVHVEWSDPRVERQLGGFRLEIKLREQAWTEARVFNVPREARSATVGGMLNHTDYELRVLALGVGSEEVVGTSAVRLVTPGWVPGVVVDYLHQQDRAFAEHGRYIGSPSIARLNNGHLIASHDLFGPGSQDFSRIFCSTDGGQSWRWLTDLKPAFWGKLFVHRGALYLLATRTEYGDLLLYRSTDGGMTWEGPAVIASGRYHKAPVPVIAHRGKLWTCIELQTGRWPSGFQAVVCSVPLEADLMEAGHWTISEPFPYNPGWLPQGWGLPVERQGYLEGNAVVAPDGRLLNILRYNTTPYYGKAIVLKIAPDGKSLSFERVIDFPGGMTKFTIRRHPQTGVYWSLVNRVTIPTAAGMRSVLSLVSSRDLLNWKLQGDILRDDLPWAVQYTGFQYADWEFEGDDLLVALRTAWNGAHNFHDANYLTFHRVRGLAGR
ncbi:MAG: exo-alpha-sialidase [Candidatus Zipacnadales bacterium]